jgi:hypothetical protein
MGDGEQKNRVVRKPDSVSTQNRILCPEKRIAHPVLGNEKGHILFGYGLECLGSPVAGGVETFPKMLNFTSRWMRRITLYLPTSGFFNR